MKNEGDPKHKKYPEHSLGKKTHSSLQHGATTYAPKRKEELLGKKDVAPPKDIIVLKGRASSLGIQHYSLEK